MSSCRPGSPPAWMARLARSSHCSPRSNSPLQIRIPARVAWAGAITGSVSQPCRAACAMASSHSRRASAEDRAVAANPRWARQATSRYGRPMARARAAPSRRYRSLSASRSDHASVTPRLSSARARRWLARATLVVDWPAGGEGCAAACSITRRSARAAARTAGPATQWPSAAGTAGRVVWWRRTPGPRYSATVRSLPENSATNRSRSGCPARDSAASRSAATQPSVAGAGWPRPGRAARSRRRSGVGGSRPA